MDDETQADEPGDETPAEDEDVDELPDDSYWDVVLEAADRELREDSYEFASLATGDLIVDDDVEDSLSALADAVDTVLEAPYRAVAVRQDREWLVGLGAEHPGRAARTRRRARAARRRGRPARARGRSEPVEDAATAEQLAAQAADLGDDYIVDAKRLDDGVWEVNAFSTGA